MRIRMQLEIVSVLYPDKRGDEFFWGIERQHFFGFEFFHHS